MKKEKELKSKATEAQQRKVIFKPVSLFRKKLPLGINDDDKKSRRLIYLKESLIFSLIMIVIDLILLLLPIEYETLPIFKNPTANILIQVIIDFIFLFGISFVFDYLVGESNIKQYNLQNKSKK